MLDGDFNPRFFHWPSLTFYVFAALFACASFLRRLVSLDPSVDYAQQVMIGRLFVAAAGTATVAILFSIGRRIAGTTTGLIAAALLAVAVLHVRESHFAMTDVLMTLLATGCLAVLLAAFDRARGREITPSTLAMFGAAGALAGLAASTKYSAVAVSASMAAAQMLLLAGRREGVLRAFLPSVVFGAALVIAFLLGTPYAVLDYERFRTDLEFDFTHLSEGHGGLDLGRGWSYHVTRSLPHGLGLSAFVAAVVGLVPLLRRHTQHGLIVLAFGIALYVALGGGRTVFFRYILPLVPLACIPAAVAVERVSCWLRDRGLPLRTARAVTVLVVLAPGVVNSVWMDLVLARTDTRVLAGRWLQEHARAGESLYESGEGYVRLHVPAPRLDRWEFDVLTGTFKDRVEGRPDWIVLQQSPLELYTAVQPPVRALVLREYQHVLTVLGTKRRTWTAVYDLHDAFFVPVAGFWELERPGPTILIYRRRDLTSGAP